MSLLFEVKLIWEEHDLIWTMRRTHELAVHLLYFMVVEQLGVLLLRIFLLLSHLSLRFGLEWSLKSIVYEVGLEEFNFVLSVYRVTWKISILIVRKSCDFKLFRRRR